MKLYNNAEKVFEAKSVKRPKFTHHRGRTWDYEIKSINGVKYDFYYDSTWGTNFYFDYQDRTYSIPIDGVMDERVLYTKKEEGIGNESKLKRPQVKD